MLQPEKQVLTYLTYTTPEVEKLIFENQHVNKHVMEETQGPRYFFITRVLLLYITFVCYWA